MEMREGTSAAVRRGCADMPAAIAELFLRCGVFRHAAPAVAVVMAALLRVAAVLVAVTPQQQRLSAAAAAAVPAQLRCVPGGAATAAVPDCYWRRDHLHCYGFPPRAPAPGSAVLSLQAAEGDSSAHSRSAACVSLARFQRESAGTCLESLQFQNFVVGWAVFDPRCVGRNCSSEVYILESVAALNPLHYDSASKEFWNFTSPVFREDGFFIAVNFNYDYNEDKHCSITLSNMYNLGLTSIKKLEVFNNENISTNLKLGLMPQLKELTIANSSIQHFPEDAHIQMPALERLSLKYNRLTSVPAAIAGMQQLQVLDLSGARLRHLAGQLPSLPQLRQLGLRDTLLCCLHQEQDAFRGVPNLQLLDISRNQLTSLGVALRGLHQLSYLDVSNNSLTEYPEMQVKDCTDGLFTFGNNRLRTLPMCKSMYHTSNALYLDVQSNNISSWDGSPDMLRCLSGLDLSNNSVSELSEAMLRTLDAVPEVDLGQNPLVCRGCALWRLQQWLVGPAPLVRAARCAAPANVAGMAVAAVAADPASCLLPPPPQRPGAALALGLSLAAAAFAAAALAAGCYRYRFELAYGAHLLRMRVSARRSRRRGNDDADSPFLFDAFILYSGNDRPWVVGTLVPLLERGPQQYRLCLHERDFQLGTVIVQNISTSMDRSRHTIVVLSKKFLSSRWCLWEMDLANHRTLEPSQREFIILLELEPLERSQLPRHLRFLMDTRTYLEWHQSADEQYEEQAFRRLKRALGPSCFTCSDTSRC